MAHAPIYFLDVWKKHAFQSIFLNKQEVIFSLKKREKTGDPYFKSGEKLGGIKCLIYRV